jgi:two-component system, cell cycle response regulator
MPRKRPPSRESAGEDHSPFSESRTTETEIVIAPRSIAPNRPILTLLTGVNAGQIFAIDRAQMVVGRAREAWVRIDAVGISRKHARITRGAGSELTIEDLGSTNGVYLNGDRVETATLTPGDQVQIGSDAVLRFSMVDGAQEELARQLYESSTRDALTGAYNRKYFTGRLDAEVAYAERHKVRLALLSFDLDYFKKVNDTHGHAAGDAVLRSVGSSVDLLLRTEDVFARCGGEEFAILVRAIAPENVRRLAERVRKTVADTRISWELGAIQVTVSIGSAFLDERADGGATGLIAMADARLYRAKHAGRNCVVSE